MKKFTLIELLVVVAILGILTSILLPSLSRARAVTKEAVCKSNQRQYHMAYSLHSEEGYSEFTGELAKRNHSPGQLLGIYNVFNRIMKITLGLNDRLLLNCPTFNEEVNSEKPSYGFTMIQPGDHQSKQSLRWFMGEIVTPSSMVLMGCRETDTPIGNLNFNTSALAQFHTKMRANVVCFDGHVEMTTKTLIQIPTNNPTCYNR